MKKFIRSTIRSIRIRTFHAIGYLSHNNRKLPDFIIIGAQKGGTSSLYYYLKFHPQVKRPIKKEIHYFNIFYDKGLRWYKAHFPLQSDKYMTGEASPGYIFHPETAKRIRDLIPKVKLIVLLRDPLERAYSAYQMNRRLGIDPRASFNAAIEYELETKKNHKGDYDYNRHNFFYLERGKYASQLSTWTKYFDKNQILVIDSNLFFNNTPEALKEVYSFLGIKEEYPKTYKPMNVGNYPPLSKENYKSLKEYFRKDISLLKEHWDIEL